MDGFDERDTIFSRMELKPGTSRYDEYYGRHPEWKVSDDDARSACGVYEGDEAVRRLVDSTFALLRDLRPLARGTAGNDRLEIAPEEATGFLKNLAETYSAVLFGAGSLDDACFYTTRGRGNEYGDTVRVAGTYGAVFAVRMRPEELAASPGPRASAEVVNGYLRVAVIGLAIARCIRGWGWNASCTMDGRADVVLPIAAMNVGLGSIGRSGLLLTDAHGPCVRLGAVVTDLPLERTPEKPGKGSKACGTCSRCADACPATAIDKHAATNGIFRKIDGNACFAKWKEFGTDCGICIASCPLSR
jgi:epoxyqueuosine reductase QueG